MNNLFKTFDAAMGRFYDHVGTLVGVSIGLFALAISLDLVMRLMGIGNLGGVQEIIEYALFAGVFLAAPWVLRLGAHVRVDLVISALSTRAARVLDRLLDFLGFTICALLMFYGTINLRDAYAFGSMQMKYFNVPEWWLLTVFVVSFVLLGIEFLSRMARGGDAAADHDDLSGGM